MNSPLVIIAGPTGVGKTAASIMLAKAVKGQIISADSMQVYKGLDIGTAKITPEEMQGVRHYLIDEIDPGQEFNIYEFKTRASRYIEKICSEGAVPILVGGTGFYIQSVLYDIEFEEESPDKDYRRQLEELAAREGGERLFEMLKEVDPASAEAIHRNNIKRIIRALEFYHETGGPISEHNSTQRAREASYNFAYFVLNRNRQEVYSRINKRVDMMIEQGLENEVRGLLEAKVPENSIAMGGLGYKEMVSYIRGNISLEEAVYDIKINTRHFAKRQITWFKREKDAIWLNCEDFPDTGALVAEMTKILKEKNIV